MNSASRQTNASYIGFSLIEVVLALALVACGIVTFMALVPVGLKSSRDATNSIIIGHILEDANERMEGRVLKDGILNSDPFFYDGEGVFVMPEESESESESESGVSGKKAGSKVEIVENEEVKVKSKENSGTNERHAKSRQLRRIYRVDVRLVSPANDVIKANAPDLKAVILEVVWPVDPETGEPRAGSNRKSISYYVNAMTGPGWSVVDPQFEALVEF